MLTNVLKRKHLVNDMVQRNRNPGSTNVVFLHFNVISTDLIKGNVKKVRIERNISSKILSVGKFNFTLTDS